MRHIISILMENEPGALSRVVGLFSQRNFNIETLNVAPTEDPSLSRLTVTTVGDDRVIEQITKHNRHRRATGMASQASEEILHRIHFHREIHQD